MRIMTAVLALACLLFASATICTAQESLDQVTPGDVPHFCGIAVGEEAQDEESQGPLPWTLKLIFADKETRQYLSNVEVTVTDEKGNEWLQTLCEGAWIVMALPAGDYDLACIFGDKTEKRKVHVGGKGTKTEYFFW